MQAVIGSVTFDVPISVPRWVAPAWILILYYSSDFETVSVWSEILALAACFDHLCRSICLEMEPQNVLQRRMLALTAAFDGKESEQNWGQREKNVIKLRQFCSELTPRTESIWLKTIKEMLDGLLKTVNSLRTTVSTNGCLFFQDLAKECGPGIDNMVEILLQNLIKLCANTKPITRSNANNTVLAIIGHVSYHMRIVQHIHNACQDKNVQPRRFACEWLKKVVKRHPRSTIEHHGGLDLIEKSIKLGLEDRDKDVREAMRPTYWNFARRWPERSETLFASLDKIKQDQLLADPSNPNLIIEPTPSNADSSLKESRATSSAPPKPPLREVKIEPAAQNSEPKPVEDSDAAAIKAEVGLDAPVAGESSTAALSKPKQAKAQLAVQKTTQKSTEGSHAHPDEAQVEAQVPNTGSSSSARNSKPTLKEIKALHIAQKRAQGVAESSKTAQDRTQSDAQGPKTGSLSAAPLRRKKVPASLTRPEVSENQAMTLPTAPITEASSGSLTRLEVSDSDARTLPNDPISEATSALTRLEVSDNDVTILRSAPLSEAPSTLTRPEVSDNEVTTLPRAPLPGTPTFPRRPRRSISESGKPRVAPLFLYHARTRISQQSLDQHGFRQLQSLLREDTGNADYETLVEPLCTWLSTPAANVSSLEWQDVQSQVITTLRLLLKNPRWVSNHYPRILTVLIVANQYYTAQGPIVLGIRKTLNFVILHCNILTCLRTVCDLMEAPHHDTVEEIGLLSLGAMLHRIHEYQDQEGAFYSRLAAEQNLVERLGHIGTCGLYNQEISIRKAAISFATEFWHAIPESQYWDVIARGNRDAQDLLKYYIAQHLRTGDHVEL